MKKDFLFCKPLTTSTKAIDVKKRVDNFFRDNDFHGIWFVQFVRTEPQSCYGENLVLVR